MGIPVPLLLVEEKGKLIFMGFPPISANTAEISTRF